MVSEGRAGQFAKELSGSEPEPWEQDLSRSELRQFIPRTTEHFEPHASRGTKEIDINEWMFASGTMPRWLGYTLGYEIVGQYLEDHPDLSASDLLDLPSTEFKPALAKLEA